MTRRRKKELFTIEPVRHRPVSGAFHLPEMEPADNGRWIEYEEWKYERDQRTVLEKQLLLCQKERMITVLLLATVMLILAAVFL